MVYADVARCNTLDIGKETLVNRNRWWQKRTQALKTLRQWRTVLLKLVIRLKHRFGFARALNRPRKEEPLTSQLTDETMSIVSEIHPIPSEASGYFRHPIPVVPDHPTVAQLRAAHEFIKRAQAEPAAFLQTAATPEYEQAILTVARSYTPEVVQQHSEVEQAADQRFKNDIEEGIPYEQALQRYLSTVKRIFSSE